MKAKSTTRVAAWSRLVVLLVAGCAGQGDGGVSVDRPVVDEALEPDFVWYVLDETEGAVAKDYSRHHFDITNLSGVTWDEGAHFDGTGGGGFVDVDPTYREAPITIGAWLTPQPRADRNAPAQFALVPYPPNAVSSDLPGSFGYGIGLNVWTDGMPGVALTVEGIGPCQAPLRSPHSCAVERTHGDPVSFEAGTEYLIVSTVSEAPAGTASSVARVYVDGELYHESMAAKLAPGPAKLHLGMHNQDAQYKTKRFFAGRIRDVRVFKRELTADEVAALYAAGPARRDP